MFALNKSPRFLLSHQEVLKGPTAFAPLEKRELLNVFSASANSRRLYWRVKQRVCFHSRPFARTSELIFLECQTLSVFFWLLLIAIFYWHKFNAT